MNSRHFSQNNPKPSLKYPPSAGPSPESSQDEIPEVLEEAALDDWAQYSELETESFEAVPAFQFYPPAQSAKDEEPQDSWDDCSISQLYYLIGQGDEDSLYDLYTRLLPLIHFVYHKGLEGILSLEDWQKESFSRLHRACFLFDESNGASFQSYYKKTLINSRNQILRTWFRNQRRHDSLDDPIVLYDAEKVSSGDAGMTVEETVLSRITFGEMIGRLERGLDPFDFRIVQLLASGLNKKEVAKILSTTRYRINEAVNKAKRVMMRSD